MKRILLKIISHEESLFYVILAFLIIGGMSTMHKEDKYAEKYHRLDSKIYVIPDLMLVQDDDNEYHYNMSGEFGFLSDDDVDLGYDFFIKRSSIDKPRVKLEWVCDISNDSYNALPNRTYKYITIILPNNYNIKIIDD